MLAQRQRDESGRFGVGHAPGDGGGNGAVQRPIREIAEFVHHARQ